MKWAGGREEEVEDGLTIPDCPVVVVGYEFWAVPRCCFVVWRWEYSLHILLMNSNFLEPYLCSKTSAILGGFECWCNSASLFSNCPTQPDHPRSPDSSRITWSAYLMISSHTPSLRLLKCYPYHHRALKWHITTCICIWQQQLSATKPVRPVKL